MRRFIAETKGLNRLGLRELCEAWFNDQWVAAHLTPEQAAESLLDCFKRAVRQELEMLELEWNSRDNLSCFVDPAAPGGGDREPKRVPALA